MAELKECPFCGQKAATFHIPKNTPEENKLHPLWEWKNPGMWVIGCNTPVCFGNRKNRTMVFFDEESAIETWNTRKE